MEMIFRDTIRDPGVLIAIGLAIVSRPFQWREVEYILLKHKTHYELVLLPQIYFQNYRIFT